MRHFELLDALKQCVGQEVGVSDWIAVDQARIELGVITWPNGADLDPDWLHEDINRSGEWRG